MSVRSSEWLENLDDERNMARLYAGLAELEKDAGRSGKFRELAEGEQRHAEIWAAKLREAGVQVPADRASSRTRMLLWMARRLGTEAVLPQIIDNESVDADKYTRQGGDAAALVAEEEAHRAVLTSMGPAEQPRAAIARREGWHRIGRGGSVRAAVFGMNDGVVSNLSLVLGVAGAGVSAHGLVLTGFAGLLAGACSMAVGEYSSVASQRDLMARQIELERREVADVPDEETAELALIYGQKGLSAEQAQAAANEIMKDPRHALDTMVREELGLDPDDLGSPIGAALSSFTMFAIGAIIPLVPFFLLSGTGAAVVSSGLCGLVLSGVGALIGVLAGTSPWRSAGRMVSLAAVAAAVTYGVGRLFGAVVG